MRTFEPDQAQRNFDDLIDRLAEDGPFKVSTGGTDLAVVVSVEMYEELLKRWKENCAGHAGAAGKP